MKARLWIRDADGQTREVSLDRWMSAGDDSGNTGRPREEANEGAVLGRDPGADITIHDPAVSRFHFQLIHENGSWVVRDLGSRNKIFLNGDPITESPFNPGDQIVVGDSEIHLIGEVEQIDTASQTQVLSAMVAAGATRATAALETLYRVSRDVGDRHEATLFLEQSLRLLCEGLHADRGAALTLDGDTLLCRAAHSQQGPALQGFVLSQSIYRTILETREPLLSRDTSDDARFRAQQSIVGEEIRSVLAAPIPLGGRLGGILYLDRLEKPGDDALAFQTEDLYAVAVAAEFLGASLDASSAVHDLTGQRDSLVKTIIDTNPILGASPAIQRVRDFIGRAAPTESTVLIQGETGTGKELVAQAIHYQSPRAGHPFVAINCAAIPETLIESELFGHEKGSFTGATARKIGKFEAGHGGTVFLDEIGELPLSCQSKLLRLLEERCFERVGGTQSVEVDVRIVAATNRDLAAESEDGNFREDLFYRLNVLQVTIAPLTERREDIELLIEHFLDYFSEKIRVRRKKFSDAARQKLITHPWPGNIRQLRNTIESCMVMAAGDEIQLDDLPIMPAGRDRAAAAWQPRSLNEVEREHIERVLDFCTWNKSKTAEILGIERSTLYARIRNYEIEPPENR